MVMNCNINPLCTAQSKIEGLFVFHEGPMHIFVQRLRSQPWTYKSKDIITSNAGAWLSNATLNIFILGIFKSDCDAVKSKFCLLIEYI